ncbi:hypothetical protein [Actinoplanes sp. M2I2]|uniref:hypothetical protein n=1 Tax=Actinoplanes sp. M2I2 TaxID=1734444 RepID=UPI002020B8E8|nr:hypothetical protein [Actinoplanes sp. M2I2]
MACLGAAALRLVGGEPTSSSSGPVGAFVSGGPSVPVAAAGPRASTTPVRANDDLSRVCEGWYYPAAPRYAGRAPHPISVGVRDQPSETSHRIKAAVEVPYTVEEKVRSAWTPAPAKAQLVACVTLIRTGAAVKKCPGVSVVRAVHSLAVHEVATGRKLLDKQLDGDVLRCPNAVPLGTGGTVPAAVSDRRLYAQLSRLVMKK